MHLFGLGAAAESLADGQEEARMVLQLAGTGVVIGGSFTDAATGLNVRASSTPAERVEGGYVIRGRKAFCSLAPALDVFYGTAGLTDGSGLLLFAIGRDAPGLSFVDTWDTMAMRGTGSWDVDLRRRVRPRVHGPGRHAVGRVGPAQRADARLVRVHRRGGVPRDRGGRGRASRASYLADRKLGGMEHPLSPPARDHLRCRRGRRADPRRPAALLFDTIRRRRDAGAAPRPRSSR